MARIDYYAIEEALAAIIRDNTNAKMVVVEEALVQSPDLSPWVGVYLNRRDAPPELQTLSAGLETVYNLRISIWAYAWALEVKKACEFRDDILGEIEIALMENREDLTTGEFWLEGGEFMSAENEDDDHFLMGAEIIVVVETTTVGT